MRFGICKFLLTLVAMLWLVRSWNISQNHSSFRRTCRVWLVRSWNMSQNHSSFRWTCRVLKLQFLHLIAKGITSSRSCQHPYHAVMPRPRLYFPCGSNAWQSQTFKFAAEALFYIIFELFQLYKEMSTFSITRSGNLKGKTEEPSSKAYIVQRKTAFQTMRPPPFIPEVNSLPIN